ncbi:hypothetical protein ACJIZ3_023354 [Penstemon smallii]|uniref:Uncharacterized protein n=1 Tax=Penstemon smallii TaxID=265156 RepID=A0ABD3TQU2_9LAMI
MFSSWTLLFSPFFIDFSHFFYRFHPFPTKRIP